MTMSLNDAMSVIKKYIEPSMFPRVGMILGSGLSPVADLIKDPITIPYSALGLQAGSVQGHASLMMFGTIENVHVVCLKGRLHLYEGTSHEAICNMIRILKLLGVHSLIVTCAVGSLRPEVGPGSIMLINDHINMQPGNPLIGLNDDSFGPRFVDLEETYDEALRIAFQKVAQRVGTPVTEGVYLATVGPCFETPAEIRAFRTLGADMVGMSTVPEVIVARHCGIRILGVAAVTNLGVGMGGEKVSHEGTLHHADGVARRLAKIMPEFIKEAAVELSE